MKKPYVLDRDAWICGREFKTGERVELTDVEAEYHLLDGAIAPAAEAPRAKRAKD